MKKWIIIVSARDVYTDADGNSTVSAEYITDDDIKVFDSQESAFESACKEAEDEVAGLMEDIEKDDDISFGIPEDDKYQNMTEVKVNYYCHEDDNTELVTRRTIKSIEMKWLDRMGKTIIKYLMQ